MPLYSSMTVQLWNQQRGPGVLLKKGVWKHVAFRRKSQIQTTRGTGKSIAESQQQASPPAKSALRVLRQKVMGSDRDLPREREERQRERKREREGEV